MQKDKKKKRKIIYVLCIVYFVVLLTLMAGNATGKGQVMVGGIAVSGMLTSVEFILAMLMTIIEYSFGGLIASILMTLGLISSLVPLIRFHSFSALPGTLYYFAGIGAIFIIRKEIGRAYKMANTDILTGVASRRYILNYVDELVTKNTPFYVLYMDLDHFKYINDTDGHERGDQVLKDVISIWKKLCKKGYTLGRINGDEFLLVVPKSKHLDIEDIAYKYLLGLRDWKNNSQLPTALTASIGIASFPDDASTGQDLIIKADMAMYSAKHSGRNRYSFYKEGSDELVIKKHGIELRITEALEKEQFYMVYQPQFEISTKKLRGFESLIRMRSDVEKPLYPGEFIPVAEKSDLIIEIGDYVLNRVMKDFADLVKANPDIIVSVNVSAKQLLEKSFIDKLKGTLERNDFPAKNLEIEITEYCLLDDTQEAIDAVVAVKNLGIQIAMDDFGTGYSSISYLTRLPIDLLKIDKSIIDTMTDGEIVKAIISMGHTLNCDIISEGVEQECQVELLKEIGCDLIQGYVWGKPMELEMAKELMLHE